MRYEIRSAPWADKNTSPRRNSGLFRATWRDTLALLADELGRLEARDPVIFTLDVDPGDVRRDGMLRANARPAHPGAAVSFQSKFGPLRYATDAYDQQWSGTMPGWQANVRAIALSLEALRAIDRWGVSRRGEQYVGWKELEASGGPVFGTADDALRWMAAQDDADALPENARTIYRNLARRMHPDTPDGDAGQWDLLQRARRLLEAGGML